MLARQNPSLVSVAVPGAPLGPLTYSLPGSSVPGAHAGLSPVDLRGRRVLVPLGKRSVVGVALGPADREPDGRLRAIEDVLDADQPAVPESLMRLSEWVSDYYLADRGETLRAALPGGLLDPPKQTLTWTGPELEGQWPATVLESPAALQAARLIAGRGSLSRSAIRRVLPRLPLHQALDTLLHAGVIEQQDRYAVDLASTYTDEIVTLAANTTEDDLPANATAQRRTVAVLAASGGQLAWSTLRDEARIARNVLTALETAGAVTLSRRPKDVVGLGFDPRRDDSPPPPLSDEQRDAAAAFTASIDARDGRAFLLDGVPGTGKTRVYLEAVKRARENGLGVIVLVPEISLTPQVVSRLRKVVDEPVAVLHSGLTGRERLAAWRGVRDGRARIVVGPRSAIFAPVEDLGLIVVDEEHEEAYKQQDPDPRYHGRDTALMRGRLDNATTILVSATPSVETVWLAQENRLQRLRLSERFGGPWPEVTVIDRRREAPDAPYISHELAEAVKTRSANGEGVVLLITRRGYSPVLQCESCGSSPGCPHCDIPLTYHTRSSGPSSRSLRCHLCGYVRRSPDQCEDCGSDDLHALGAGTQRIEEEIQQRFPALAPVRMDRDTMRKSGDQERVLRSFAEGDAQILLGTQLVAKGHDFAHVALVGVINADPALHQPDFRAAERTFRLLVQAAGRAGRGGHPGRVMIQTLRPDHSLFTFLRGPHLDAFMNEELQRRRAFLYPPWSRMIRLTAAGNDDDRVRRTAGDLAELLGYIDPTLSILGPEPALVPRVKRAYRHHILIRTPRSEDPAGKRLRAAARAALEKISPEPGVKIQVDVDPSEVL